MKKSTKSSAISSGRKSSSSFSKASTSRRFVVFASLVLVLTLTSAMLLALAPAPLTPDASASLFAVDAPDAMDVIFQTKTPCQPGNWKYIYIHHSRTQTGNAMTIGQSTPAGLGDHFVIGNGEGAADGEIQVGQRWDTQASALPPTGAAKIEPNCISICLIGDFDRHRPTASQLRRLAQLINALQAHFRIPAGDVSMITQSGKESTSAAAIGRFFPANALREQLLP